MTPLVIDAARTAYAPQSSTIGQPEERIPKEETGALQSVAGLECVTCANRQYQDGSGDPGVSMKSPTQLNPAQAASAVISHEREHYNREQAKAEEDGREVLSNEIQIFTSVCPECGKTYVSGGKTTTVTRAREENGDFAKQFFDQILGGSRAEVFDEKI